MTPPFFQPRRPQLILISKNTILNSLNIFRVLNYGSLGSLIGHELAHSLDPSGITADKAGNVVSWPIEDLTKYNTKTECLTAKLATRVEHMADRVGIKISLAAFQKQKVTSSRFIKMFFISFAQVKTIFLFDNCT